LVRENYFLTLRTLKGVSPPPLGLPPWDKPRKSNAILRRVIELKQRYYNSKTGHAIQEGYYNT